MTRTLLLSVAAFCAFSVSAGEDVQFSTVDANADGFIFESEFVGWKTATGEHSAAEALVEFIEIDADASGMISEDEMTPAMAAKETSESTLDDQM